MEKVEVTKEKIEEILDDKSIRYSLFPIKYQDLFDLAKMGKAAFWVVGEVDLEEDLTDWTHNVKSDEKKFISMVLAFFANSDSIVMENLAIRFMTDVKCQEAKTFYSYQIENESTHNEMYSLLIDTYINDENEKMKLFNAIENYDVIKQKANWAFKYITSSDEFATRLVAFACVEGIFFSSSFCAIYWFKKRGLLPGLTFSNELISRDEALHCKFAYTLYDKLTFTRLSREKVLKIVTTAVELEQQFAKEIIPDTLIGMNSNMMCQYIECVADVLLMSLKYEKYYKTPNPFSFMDLIALDGKSNFFERRVSEYKKDNKKRITKLKVEDFNSKDF